MRPRAGNISIRSAPLGIGVLLWALRERGGRGALTGVLFFRRAP